MKQHQRLIIKLVVVLVIFITGLNLHNTIYAQSPAPTSTENVHIYWAFSIYAEPDFQSERIASFDPQTVNILYRSDNGWALICTAFGDSWVYLNANMRFIDRRMGLFEHKEDEFHTSIVSPQVVTVLEREGRWLEIETWIGPMWLYLDFVPPTYELDNLLSRFGNNLSVYFENLDTGFIYRYNADRVYFSASVPKASFALYIYQKAERGETDLDSIHTFIRADYMGGSGVIRHRYAVGTTFTQRELLRLNLSYSDNIATNMLVRIHGVEGYRQFVADIGGNPDFVQDRIMNSDLTANEAGLFAREIFRYIEAYGTCRSENNKHNSANNRYYSKANNNCNYVNHNYVNRINRYGNEFREHLLNNQYPFIVSDYPIASKTGWTRPIAWHDMAIVYAPSPYILVILSARDGWSAQDYADFTEISMAFQRFNDRWFGER